MEIEVRFGLARVGLEMEREIGKLLEPHNVLSQLQLTVHPNMFVSK